MNLESQLLSLDGIVQSLFGFGMNMGRREARVGGRGEGRGGLYA